MFDTAIYRCAGFSNFGVTIRHRSITIITLRAKHSGAVYCYRSCLWRAEGRADGVCGGRAVSVTMITRNCVHRSSPNWVCRCR